MSRLVGTEDEKVNVVEPRAQELSSQGKVQERDVTGYILIGEQMQAFSFNSRPNNYMTIS